MVGCVTSSRKPNSLFTRKHPQIRAEIRASLIPDARVVTFEMGIFCAVTLVEKLLNGLDATDTRRGDPCIRVPEKPGPDLPIEVRVESRQVDCLTRGRATQRLVAIVDCVDISYHIKSRCTLLATQGNLFK